MARIQNVVELFRPLFAPRFLVAIFMIAAVAFHADAGESDVRRAMREAVVFILMTGCSNWRIVGSWLAKSKLVLLVVTISSCMLILVLLQLLFIRRGVYFGLPQPWFSQNSGTLPSDLDLLYGKVRAAGTFGEPSYLGGFCLSMLFATSSAGYRDKANRILVMLLIAIPLLSGSASGGLFCGALLAIIAARRAATRGRSLVLHFVAIAIVVSVAIFVSGMWTRLQNILSGNDPSAEMRVFAPLRELPGLLVHSPLGVAYASHLQISDNGFLNILFDYGWLGVLLIVPVIGICFRRVESIVYVLLLSFQNGAFFSIDKFCLVASSMMLFNRLAEDKSVKTVVENRNVNNPYPSILRD
jgi:hypothetical protein